MKNTFEGKVSFEEFQKMAIKNFNSKKRRFLKALNKDYQLLMVHVYLADWIGHLRRGDLTTMWETYIALEQFAREVKEKLTQPSLLLIVSDHGMRPFGRLGYYGHHSDYGFYSSNTLLNLKEPKITDFYHIISRTLREAP